MHTQARNDVIMCFKTKREHSRGAGFDIRHIRLDQNKKGEPAPKEPGKDCGMLVMRLDEIESRTLRQAMPESGRIPRCVSELREFLCEAAVL